MLRSMLAPLVLALASPTAPAVAQVDYAADVEFALEALDEQCGHFFKTKDVDWKKVAKEFKKEVKRVESDQEHLVLLTRLLARLEDGHAQVRPLAAGQGVTWPEQPERTGPGLFLCEAAGKLYVKNAYNDAADLGIEAGWELVKIDGQKAMKWFEAKVAEEADLWSFSTDHQARFHTMHRGLSMEVGTRLDIEFKTPDRKKKSRTITYRRANPVPWGPAVFPEGLEGDSDVAYGTLPSGHGYIHIRRCKGDLPDRVGAALEAIGNVPGVILDWRANSGGGFDHDDLLGRFVPEGFELAFAKRVGSSGSYQYGGPVVVIVDGGCASAGETGSGMFKEDGRAYLIGDGPTAGMSSSKTTIELPSGLFSLYVSVASNKGRFNDGRGIEGVGVIPNEAVEYDPEDLVEGRDTLIERAVELFDDFPDRDVWYDPAKAGWEG